jgi:hypothetical protein
MFYMPRHEIYGWEGGSRPRPMEMADETMMDCKDEEEIQHNSQHCEAARKNAQAKYWGCVVTCGGGSGVSVG